MNKNTQNARKRQKVANINAETGEVLDGVFVYFSPKRNPYGKGWIMNSQEALEILAKDTDLKWETLRVFLFLCARLDFENWILIQSSEICKELSMKPPNVSRSITLLEKKGIIIRGEKLGRSYAFRLNPHYGWKGKVKNLDDYRRKEDDRERREFRDKFLNSDESE
jgi:DNA-binding transcriptional ArsR family regulator